MFVWKLIDMDQYFRCGKKRGCYLCDIKAKVAHLKYCCIDLNVGGNSQCPTSHFWGINMKYVFCWFLFNLFVISIARNTHCNP